ncbi:hypothetical protein CKAH01_16639 [Colletotrichum kahawae]|uniref:Uncharacterized protein n=1 Tax=Colletotrichum kahawae TaxID=34407 RepID=A0AAD9YF91_COLKA|nr:hypothetical protein CKAH01_16639 [Colletotrichum kahawae]
MSLTPVTHHHRRLPSTIQKHFLSPSAGGHLPSPSLPNTLSPFALAGQANEHCRSRGQSGPAQPRPQDAVNAVFPANWVKFGQARAQS